MKLSSTETFNKWFDLTYPLESFGSMTGLRDNMHKVALNGFIQGVVYAGDTIKTYRGCS